MNTAFAMQGTLFLLAAVLVARGRRRRPFLALAACNAVGNLVVAMVPSGPSGIGWLHTTGAVLAIVGGNAAILAGWSLVSTARWYRAASIAVAALGLASFALLAVASVGAVVLPAAVWERTSVYTIIGWQMLSAVVLLRAERAGRPAC